MVTYIIYEQSYSETAARIHGYPYVWDPVAKTRLKPPQDEQGFLQWLLHLVKGKPGTYRVNRTHSEGEKRGFHPLGYFVVNEDHLRVQRKYKEIKSHPGLGPSRQLYYKKVEDRQRFRRRGKKRFN